MTYRTVSYPDAQSSGELPPRREPHIRTPAHDPGRPNMGSPDWWRARFDAAPDWWSRVFAEPFVRPGMACPHCGRSSDAGDLHWPWCGRNNADG